jgi:drug/metabolite transporter (DMT)-like permease
LPLSTYSALRALSPVLALSAGTLMYGDRPSVAACLGIVAILLGVVTVSRTDYRRTLSASGTSCPRRHLTLSYILAVSAATCSAIMPIYDKNLLSIAHADSFVLQALSDLYRLGLLLVILLFAGRPATPLSWRLSQSAKNVSRALAVAALLIAGGEMLSFYAVSLPGSLPSVVAILRRASLPVSAILGKLVFGEALRLEKIAGIVAVVLGIMLINGT